MILRYTQLNCLYASETRCITLQLMSDYYRPLTDVVSQQCCRRLAPCDRIQHIQILILLQTPKLQATPYMNRRQRETQDAGRTTSSHCSYSHCKVRTVADPDVDVMRSAIWKSPSTIQGLSPLGRNSALVTPFHGPQSHDSYPVQPFWFVPFCKVLTEAWC